MVLALAILCAYLAGSLPFAKILSARKGIDIQAVGSGNPGFANTMREVGWSTAWKVLAGDVLKGFIPTIVAAQFLHTPALYLVGLSAIGGHLFSILLKFKGGKGIATGLGVTLAIAPLVGAVGFVCYLVTLGLVRKSAVASLCGAYVLPLAGWWLQPEHVAFLCLLPLLATWTHRHNLIALLGAKRHRSAA